MRAGVLALLGVGIFCLPLRADLQIRVKETFSGGTVTRVEYYKGTRWRIDFGSGGSYRIVDSANKSAITVDPAKREYSVHTSTRTEPIIDPSQTIAIEIEGRDTGEQRQMFGHTVHHIITTERRHTEYADKPWSETSETQTDGWYMDVAPPLGVHSRVGTMAVLGFSGNSRYAQPTFPKIKTARKGRMPHGLPVWEKTGDNVLEVTEFSEAPLNPSLFEIPEGFRRVVRAFPGETLSWSDQMLFHWQEFEDWLGSLF